MTDMISYEKFLEAWNDLERNEKISLYNDFAREHAVDDEIFSFDEEFFNMYFEGNPMEAARAVYFGKIECWNDEYIKFNGYGNLVSMSDYQAAEWADDYTREIYKYPELWREYIDEDDYADDEEEDCE